MVAVYRFADIGVAFVPQNEEVGRRLAAYRDDSAVADVTITLNADDFACEQTAAPQMTATALEMAALLRRLSDILLMQYNGLLLHAATVIYQGKAYAFTAPAGTGKTTHIRLWRKVLGEDARILNGDKLLLRRRNGRVMAYGNPWKGKEDLGENAACELGGVYILQRAEQNSICDVQPVKALPHLLAATVYPKRREGKQAVLRFLEHLTLTTDIGVLRCNMQDEAVMTVLTHIESRRRT